MNVEPNEKGHRISAAAPISLTVIGSPACTVPPIISENQRRVNPKEPASISLCKYSGESARGAAPLSLGTMQSGGVSCARLFNPTRQKNWTRIRQVPNYFGMICGGNRLGQAVCCCTTRLARAALRPPAAPHQSRGPSAPVHPTTRNPARFLRPFPTVRGLDARPGFRARPHDEGARPRPLDLSQPCAGWMRGNGLSRCIDIRGLAPKPRVRLSRPTPRAGARPLHSDP